jgi:hypothetical protein
MWLGDLRIRKSISSPTQKRPSGLICISSAFVTENCLLGPDTAEFTIAFVPFAFFYHLSPSLLSENKV